MDVAGRTLGTDTADENDESAAELMGGVPPPRPSITVDLTMMSTDENDEPAADLMGDVPPPRPSVMVDLTMMSTDENDDDYSASSI
jgi:hypothetical protein